MTSTRRRQYWFLCGAAVLALAVPAGLAHHLDRRLHRDLEPRLADAFGVGVEIGSIEATLGGTLRLERVRVSRLFAADAVEASVALSSLLGGHIQADEIRLDRPRLHVYLERDGHSNLERLVRRVAAARQRHLGASATGPSDRSRRPPRIVVTRGDLAVDLGGRGELHLSGLALHPQAGGVRVVAGTSSLAVAAGPWNLAGRFERGAADVALPAVEFDRLLAVGGELALGAEHAAPTRLYEATLAHRPGDGRGFELSARAVRAGADAQVTARVRARHGALTVALSGQRVPLAALQPLVPRALDLAAATASGQATVDLAGGDEAVIDAQAAVAGIAIDDRHIADRRFEIDGELRLLASVSASGAGHQVVVDELHLRRGALDAELSGQARFRPGHALPDRAVVDLAMPRVGCMDAFAALPDPFTRHLAGLYATGTTRASLHLAFDRAAADDTELDVDVDLGDCRVTSEASEADPHLIARPFDHVFPDGSSATVGYPIGDYAILRSLPSYVTGAFVAAEDARFFDHHGFDPHQIERSLAVDLASGRLVRGGSTISQQLVKNVFLSSERSLARKFQEAVLTWRLEQVLGKRLILERYLNIIELGSGVFGISAGARHWFGKPAQELTVAEVAFLAAITPAPRSVTARIRAAGALDPATADQVRVVLRHMRRGGVIGEAAYRRALAAKLALRGPLVAAR